MSSQQSKDNTCPSCYGNDYIEVPCPGTDMPIGGNCAVLHTQRCKQCHGSGEQEDKPTMDEIRDTANKMYGQLAEELSKTSVLIEPSKPDQLRDDPRNRKYEIKALLDRAAGEEFQVINGKYYFLEDFVKALLATEYDRGKVETIELALALIGEDEPTRLERDVTYTAHQDMDIFLAAARNELRQKLRQSLKELT